MSFTFIYVFVLSLSIVLNINCKAVPVKFPSLKVRDCMKLMNLVYVVFSVHYTYRSKLIGAIFDRV